MSKLPIPYRLFIDDIRDKHALALEQGRELKDPPARMFRPTSSERRTMCMFR